MFAMSLSTTTTLSRKAMWRRSMHCNFYCGINDDVSLFLLCLWFCASPHLPHPIAIHKAPWHLLVEFIPFTNITCNVYICICLRRSSCEQTGMNLNFHSITNSLTFARIWGGLGKPTAFGGPNLTIVDFDVDFADVVPCAFRTARRGRLAASSRTCESSCQIKPHSCAKWMCYKKSIVNDI
jgi:hypothetical protein